MPISLEIITDYSELCIVLRSCDEFPIDGFIGAIKPDVVKGVLEVIVHSETFPDVLIGEVPEMIRIDGVK